MTETDRPKVLSAQLSHETNTFSSTPTTLASFGERMLLRGEEIAHALRGTNSEISAHLEAAERHGWTLVQPLAAHATPSGRSTAATWRELSQTILQDCTPDLAGVLLALHGAMVTEDEEDAEGALLAGIRRIVGPEVPVIATLDLHANVTDRMAEQTNALFAYRSYPHVDQYEVAREAADELQRLIRSGEHSRCVVARAPLLDGCDHGRTHADGVMNSLLDLADDLRSRHEGVSSIAICAGFPWADIAQAGPTVSVSGTASAGVLREVARQLTEAIWESRHETSAHLLSLDEMVQVLSQSQAGPVVVADFTDNPGHGAPGDGVRILAAVLKAGLQNIAVADVLDPESAAACAAAGVGAEVDLLLGAKRNPAVYGEPLAVRAKVLRVGDASYVCAGPMWRGVTIRTGLTAVIDVSGVQVIVTSSGKQTIDRQAFISQGIDPTACRAVVVKSQQHFRGAYDPIASRTILVDAGGAVSPQLGRLPYQRVRRPVWPLDQPEFDIAYSRLE